jgi:hypothetical protein
VIFSLENVVWDQDAEEDSWALPVPCDGWEKAWEARSLELTER